MAGFLLVALIPLVTSTVLGYVRSYGILEELTEGSVQAVSELGVVHVRNRMERNYLFLHAVASGNEFLAGALRHGSGVEDDEIALEAGPEAVARYLRRQRDEDDGPFSALFLMDPDGRIVASTHLLEVEFGTLPPVSDAHRVVTIEGPDRDGPPSFLLLEPVTRLDGRRVGVLAGLVRASRAHAFFQVPPSGSGEVRTYILDELGRPIFASGGPGSTDYSEPLPSPLLAASAEGRARYRDPFGEEVIGTRSDIPGYPWVQVTEIPVEAAMASLRRLRMASLYLTLGFVVLVGTAAWLLSAQIVAPVRVLVGAVRRLGSGDPGARVSLDQNDEIGELATAFNTMAEELEAASARVAALHQREIERAQQLATVGELASGLAHEIKNPMVAIANGMDLVRRRVGPTEDLDLILNELGREVDRVQRTIRDLLTFAGPSSPDPSITDANELAESALRLTRASASAAGLVIVVDLEPGLPKVLVDAEQMRQALVNLILNAIQATPSGGTVRVRTLLVAGPTERPFSTGGSGDVVEFQVQDTGPGIAEADRVRVFRPFYTTRTTGTGLGLSISRGIVDRHGGELELRCPAKGGTLAVVRIPAVGAARSVSPAGSPVPPSPAEEEDPWQTS
jgi:signal transduction histidine kinase